MGPVAAPAPVEQGSWSLQRMPAAHTRVPSSWLKCVGGDFLLVIVFVNLDLGFAVPLAVAVLPGSWTIEPMRLQPKNLLRRTHDMLVLDWPECGAVC